MPTSDSKFAKYFIEEDDEPLPQKRGRGRPTGSISKTPEAKMLEGMVVQLYNSVEGLLDPDQKKYLKEIKEGRTGLDPVKESELLIRSLSIIMTAAMQQALDNNSFTQDLAKIAAEYRMGIKDLEDMRRKREDARMKNDDNGDMVNPTRESSLARFKSLPRSDS